MITNRPHTSRNGFALAAAGGAKSLRRWWAVGGAVALLLLGLGGVPANARTPAEWVAVDGAQPWVWGGSGDSIVVQPSAAGPADDLASLVVTLNDEAATAANRTDAAHLIVQRALAPDSSSAARSAVEHALSGSCNELSPAWYVLGALLRVSSVPEWLLPVMSGVIDKADDRTAARALSVMGAIRTRPSARAILTVGSSAASSEAVRRAAWIALARLSGRSDLGDDGSAWRAWLDDSEALSIQEWDQRLAQGLARRADALEAERQAARGRLVEAYRRMHVTLPAEQRPEYLAGLLRDDIAELRSLGFELASRELSENAQLGPEVAAAATALLESKIASVRGQAGLLIAQISPAGAETAITAALVNEADPGAASAMLRAAARWPSDEMIDVALRWTTPDLSAGQAIPSAVEYLRALLRAGGLQGEADRARVLAAIRGLLPDQVPPGACDLLVYLGGEDDVRSVAMLLGSDSAPLRQAAAQSLLSEPSHLDDILLAAQVDPDLFDTAVRGVSMYWASAEGFRSIASLKAPSHDAWRRGLLRLAELLPAPDLVQVSGSVDPGLREPLLANLTSVNRILSERLSTATFEALGHGLLMLARLRLELNKPDNALAAIDAMQELFVLQGEDAVNAVRVEALLCLGRLGEAEVIRSGPDPWIAALARSSDKPFARAIVDGIEVRFGDGLTPAQKSRIEAIVRRLPSTATSPTVPAGAESRPGADPR